MHAKPLDSALIGKPRTTPQQCSPRLSPGAADRGFKPRAKRQDLHQLTSVPSPTAQLSGTTLRPSPATRG